ncbi:dATP/dGTP diphosphohydrolase domain-containing protein, partial [Escherichia coli]|uniref:dATP/dGTP diphosphohydrolase domain-containing protein n=3 Tax=Pseudomonadota TaxID=1224 RepID=UPI00339CEF67
MTEDWITRERPPKAVPEATGTERTTLAQDGGMLRFNSGKLRMSLVPASLGRYTAAALGYGAIKYSANNWRRGGSWTSGYESLQRHL